MLNKVDKAIDFFDGGLDSYFSKNTSFGRFPNILPPAPLSAGQAGSKGEFKSTFIKQMRLSSEKRHR